MMFDEYQEVCKQFAIYPKDREREYLSLGLLSEVGELAGKVKKEIRDGVDLTEAILDELGDCEWYTAMICNHLGTTMKSYADDFRVSEYHHISLHEIVYNLGSAASTLGLCIDSSDLMIRTSLRTAVTAAILVASRRATTIEAVCARNIAKLTDRKNRDKLGGSGDAR